MTEEFVDLEARLGNWKAAEVSLERLLDQRQQTGKISDIIEVQQKLFETRSQVEQTEGRLRYLTDQAAFSTISVDLIPEISPAPPTPAPTPLPAWQPGNTTRETSQTLAKSMQRTVDSLIWTVIAIVPMVLLYLAPVAFLFWLFRRGWKRYRTTHSHPPV